MSYYTTYELFVSPFVDSISIGADSTIGFILEEGRYKAVWHKEERHKGMKVLSKKYPDHTFLLTGQGEEWADLWREYYKNGKMVRYSAVIKVSYPDFDENDLE